ncbi:MAG TPA: hypothetical protein VF683_06395 [Chthoniobacterales bacterium]
MSRISRWLPRAVFESFLIVVSIVVALAVNEWRERHARLERVAEARGVFVNEIESNRTLLRSEDYLPHHRRLQAEYERLAAENSDAVGTLFETGVHPAPLRDAAWRSFSAGATLVDFGPAELVMLSDIYRAQEDLARSNANFLGQVVAPRSDREMPEYKRDQTRSISMYLNDVVPLEERLLHSYDAAVERLRP